MVERSPGDEDRRPVHASSVTTRNGHGKPADGDASPFPGRLGGPARGRV